MEGRPSPQPVPPPRLHPAVLLPDVAAPLTSPSPLFSAEAGRGFRWRVYLEVRPLLAVLCNRTKGTDAGLVYERPPGIWKLSPPAQ